MSKEGSPITLADLREMLQPWDRYGFKEWHDGLDWGARMEPSSRGRLHLVMQPHAPEDLQDFLAKHRYFEGFRHPRLWREMNGFNLFFRGLCLYGPDLLCDPPRVWRAFDVVSMNVGQGDLHHRFDGIIFGGARFAGRNAWLMESLSGEIVSVDRATLAETFRWADFDTFLMGTLRELMANWSDTEREVVALSFLQRLT